jgi:hypothetical protein
MPSGQRVTSTLGSPYTFDQVLNFRVAAHEKRNAITDNFLAAEGNHKHPAPELNGSTMTRKAVGVFVRFRSLASHQLKNFPLVERLLLNRHRRLNSLHNQRIFSVPM